MPDADLLDLTDGLTLSAWVRPAALGTTWRTVLFKTLPGNHVYALYANQDTTRPVGGSVRQATGPAELPVNAWSHLATTYDGTALRLYVDGSLVATSAIAGAIATSAGDLWIGGNPVWSEWFAGLLDEIRIYRRALSADEIRTDMSVPAGGV